MLSTDKLIILEEANSTQDIAIEMARQGAHDGTAVMTLNQTAGRGRMGRSWASPSGKNLALSFIIRPSCEPSLAPLYGLMASVAAAQTVEAFCLNTLVQVKWPNDVIVEGRKIAGILPQAQVINNNVEFVIVGLGLNVNSAMEDFPVDIIDKVTSMADLSGESFDLTSVARSFLSYMKALRDGPADISFKKTLELWNSKWAHRGCYVNRTGIEGIAEGIDVTGALLVRAKGGELLKISSGEVNF